MKRVNTFYETDMGYDHLNAGKIFLRDAGANFEDAIVNAGVKIKRERYYMCLGNL